MEGDNSEQLREVDCTTVTLPMEDHNKRFLEALTNPTLPASWLPHTFEKEGKSFDNLNGFQQASTLSADKVEEVGVHVGVDGKTNTVVKVGKLVGMMDFYCQRNSKWEVIKAKILSLIPQDIAGARQEVEDFHKLCESKGANAIGSSIQQIWGKLLLEAFDRDTKAGDVEKMKLFPLSFLKMAKVYDSNNCNNSEFRLWILNQLFAELEATDNSICSIKAAETKLVTFELNTSGIFALLENAELMKLQYRIQLKKKIEEGKRFLKELILLILHCEPPETLAKFSTRYPEQVANFWIAFENPKNAKIHFNYAVMNRESSRLLAMLLQLHPQLIETIKLQSIVCSQQFEIPIKNICYLLKRQLLSAESVEDFLMPLILNTTPSSIDYTRKCEKLFQIFLYLDNFYQPSQSVPTEGKGESLQKEFVRPTSVWNDVYAKYLRYTQANELTVTNDPLPLYTAVIESLFMQEQEVSAEVIEFSKDLKLACTNGDVDWIRQHSEEIVKNNQLRHLCSSPFLSVRSYFIKLQVQAQESSKSSAALKLEEKEEKVDDESLSTQLMNAVHISLRKEGLETAIEIDRAFALPLPDLHGFKDMDGIRDGQHYRTRLYPFLMENPDERVLDYFLTKCPDLVCKVHGYEFRKIQPRIFVYLLRHQLEIVEKYLGSIVAHLFNYQDELDIKLYKRRTSSMISIMQFIFKLFLLLGNFCPSAQQQNQMWSHSYDAYLQLTTQLPQLLPVTGISALMLQYFV